MAIAVAVLVGQQLGQRGPAPNTLGTLKSIADCISIAAAVSNTLHADGAEQVRRGAATHSAGCVRASKRVERSSFKE